jgi:hypothetical protein
LQTRGECEICGYRLAGLEPGGNKGTCPECGATFYAADIFDRSGSPPWWRLALRACWPTTALCAVLSAVAATGGLMLICAGWPPLVGALVLATLVHPYELVNGYTERYVLRAARTRFRRAAFASLAAVNFVQACAILRVALRWL